MADDPQKPTDIRALEMAAENKGELKAHRAICEGRFEQSSARYKELGETFAATDQKRDDQFGAVYLKIDALAESVYAKLDAMTSEKWNWRQVLYIGVIVFLLSVVGYLLVNGPPWPN